VLDVDVLVGQDYIWLLVNVSWGFEIVNFDVFLLFVWVVLEVEG